MEDKKNETSMEDAIRPIHRKHHDSMHNEKNKLNPKSIVWTLGILSAVLSVLFIVSIATHGFSKATAYSSKNVLSQDDLKTKISSYLQNAVQGQSSIDSIKDEGDLYSVQMTIGGKQYSSFATKDGSLLFPQGLDLNQKAGTTASATQQAQTNVPKADKPQVELFVMSYCPYGTQAEKGILPAVRTLGDKVDFKVKFVYYAMHGKNEIDENLRQYCIQKEQPDKFNAYLACFLNASDSPSCLKSTGIDTTKLDSCISVADTKFDITKNWNDQSSWLSGRFPLFNTDISDNKKYSVGGSPTLVINGVQSNAGRDSSSYLAAICNAMNTKALECNTQLSAVAEGPGFGYGSAAVATAAGCGVAV